jgi:hypothetical protein
MSELLAFIAKRWPFVVAVAAAGAAILPVLRTVTDLAEKYASYRKKRRLTTLPGISFHEGLRNTTNSRFGFRHAHPPNWDKRYSGNSDGCLYVHPQDPRIEFRAWGGYAVAYESLHEWVAGSTSGTKVVTEVASDKQPTDGCLDAQGVRVVFDAKINGTRCRTMRLFLQPDKRQIGLSCQAPMKFFADFEELFLALIDSVVVMREPRSVETEEMRRQQILELLKELQPNQSVYVNGIYLSLLAENPDLVADTTVEDIEAELEGLRREGFVKMDASTKAWSYRFH